MLSDDTFINVPNYPFDGFNFPDITSLMENDPILCHEIIDSICSEYCEHKIDGVVCIESFGYIFGAPLAHSLRSKIILARKENRLPRRTVKKSYDMVYASGRAIEINNDAIIPGERFIIVDDFLASGGTSQAVVSLVKQLGGDIVDSCFVVEIPFMNGRHVLESEGVTVNSLITLDFVDADKKWKIVSSSI